MEPGVPVPFERSSRCETIQLLGNQHRRLDPRDMIAQMNGAHSMHADALCGRQRR